MKFKNWIALIATGLVALCLTACGSAKSSGIDVIKSKGKLVVATSPDYAPFEFQTLVNGKNEVVGADMDLAKAIADELGVELEISTMSFDNVLTSLQAGKADLAISGLAVTEEREAVFDFSESYYETKISLLVRKEDVNKYANLESFEGVDVAAQKGSIPETMVKEQLPKAHLISLTNMGEAINELQTGKVDAVNLDEPVALSYAAQNKDLAIAKVALKATGGDANAVAMQKGNKELKEVVDKVVKKVKEDGTYKTYLEKASALSEPE
ncbi:transporter substrate-binding domain-containing protein [Streptococcus himalayensis]|uniref:Amino acid ABC transporter substrate-binding protein n=1 Tax=Streptococcus himalayensis TaxID=1888195 RepID=A0A917A9W5_9STRE|nr:transporter substrate-binding domain-containing protein [Streptococcus himalayensis]GGE36658.1 amino acid ABC transporter substrate-binding protein [Streptococcus himalayensis]